MPEGARFGVYRLSFGGGARVSGLGLKVYRSVEGFRFLVYSSSKVRFRVKGLWFG